MEKSGIHGLLCILSSERKSFVDGCEFRKADCADCCVFFRRILCLLQLVGKSRIHGLLCILSSDFPMEVGQIFILFRKTCVNNN